MGDYPAKTETAQFPEAGNELQIVEQERRAASRKMLVASAEAEELTSGARVHSRTSDVSTRGCYLDTINPFATGTRVRIHLTKGNEIFDSLAVVSNAREGMGMGVEFTETSQAAREMIERWIVNAESGGTSGPSSSPAWSELPEIPNNKDINLRLERLAHVLAKKGVLSEEELWEILS